MRPIAVDGGALRHRFPPDVVGGLNVSRDLYNSNTLITRIKESVYIHSL